MEGRILVDDILTSCYASVHHDLAHIGMMPIRWFPEFIEWIFGEMNESVPYIKINENLGIALQSNIWSNKYLFLR